MYKSMKQIISEEKYREYYEQPKSNYERMIENAGNKGHAYGNSQLHDKTPKTINFDNEDYSIYYGENIKYDTNGRKNKC